MSIEARFLVRRAGFTLDLDLSIPARGVSAVFGPSGCGKTTLLRAIAGLDHHADGQLTVSDQVWQEGAYFRPPHQRAVGYVFQEASLFAHLNVQKNLEFGYRRVPPEQRKVSFEQAIDLLGVTHLLARQAHRLSGGERQRVAIARALLVSPQVLLMDEPLNALDAQSKQEIMPYITSLHRELAIPVLYVSHSSDEVAQLADHLILLEEGKLRAQGDINTLLTRLDLSVAHSAEAEALLEAQVMSHDDEFHLTALNTRAGTFRVARKAVPVGQQVRLRIAAKDVSITLTPQTGTSILNIFSATIEEIAPDGDAQVILRLLLEGAPILARITRKSAADLELEVGKQVYAQVKSVALLS